MYKCCVIQWILQIHFYCITTLWIIKGMQSASRVQLVKKWFDRATNSPDHLFANIWDIINHSDSWKNPVYMNSIESQSGYTIQNKRLQPSKNFQSIWNPNRYVQKISAPKSLLSVVLKLEVTNENFVKRQMHRR